MTLKELKDKTGLRPDYYRYPTLRFIFYTFMTLLFLLASLSLTGKWVLTVTDLNTLSWVWWFKLLFYPMIIMAYTMYFIPKYFVVSRTSFYKRQFNKQQGHLLNRYTCQVVNIAYFLENNALYETILDDIKDTYATGSPEALSKHIERVQRYLTKVVEDATEKGFTDETLKSALKRYRENPKMTLSVQKASGYIHLDIHKEKEVN